MTTGTQETRLIVRIASKDLNGSLPVHRALVGIKGIGIRAARAMAYAFENKTRMPYDTPLGKLSDDQDKVLEEIVAHPQEFLPVWMLNRRKDLETGKNMHLVMADLDFSLRNDLQRMKKLKSYKGLRHSLGLTVRGQRTQTSGRKRGSAVGVAKGDVKAAAKAATAKSSAKPASGEGKK